MVPQPVTTLSARMRCSSRPKSFQRWVTKGSSSRERAFVEQQVDALAGGQPAAGVLGFDALGAAAQAGLGFHLVQSCDL